MLDPPVGGNWGAGPAPASPEMDPCGADTRRSRATASLAIHGGKPVLGARLHSVIHRGQGEQHAAVSCRRRMSAVEPGLTWLVDHISNSCDFAVL